jgi:hypothetical protein
MRVVVHGNRIKRRKRKEGEKITPRTLVCALNQFFSPFRPCPRTCVCDTHTHTLTQQIYTVKKKRRKHSPI